MKNISFLFLSPILILSCTSKKPVPQGLSPAEALNSFVLQDSFRIELVASEPLVADPVAMELDENGNIYVVEMHGYPLDKSGSGLIKKLTDTNGDGQPDKSIVFADHLRLPNGITRWKNGFLVTDVPAVLYLEDRDGDGRAEIRDTVITGFAVSNPQHDANTPVFGLDNWIYIAHEGEVTPKVYVKEFGDTGSSVRFPGRPDAPVLARNADGRNVRFQPDQSKLEEMSGDGQYGQTFDPWGHHLLAMNYKHLYQEVISARYLANNPNLLVAGSLQNLPDHGNAAEVFPITRNPEHQLLTDVGVVTSACGVTWYQGGLFPERFNNITFVAEPVHNLVHIDQLKHKGASFTASRVYEQKEFLASTDPWFRPVQFYIGPDGALYMIDYYRQIIEHPEWTSEEVAKSGALYNGTDKGRIYRITPAGTKPMNWCGKLSLNNTESAILVSYLASPNIWWRRNAQRLLVHRKDESLPGLLHAFFDSTHSAVGKVHAIWTLEGIGQTDPSLLVKAFQHPVPGLRENAIRIAELHLATHPELIGELIRLKSDPDPKVRYQLLCTLGFVRTDRAAEARREILLQDIEDRWVQVAALSASYGEEWAMLEKAKKSLGGSRTDGRRMFFDNCAAVIGLSGNEKDIKNLVALATVKTDTGAAWWQSACLEGLEKGISAKGLPGADFSKDQASLLALFSSGTPASLRRSALKLAFTLGKPTQEKWNELIGLARKTVMDPKQTEDMRVDALLLLKGNRDPANENIYQQLINPLEPEKVQEQAIVGYVSQVGKKACMELVSKWKNLTPSVRETAMDQFLNSSENMQVLLDAVAAGDVQPSSIGWGRSVELMNNDDTAVKSRARKLLAGPMEDRDAVYKKYESAIKMNGNPARGLAVFTANCSICHQVGGEKGKAFGPDLATIRNRDPSFILADILNPNRSIADGYDTWSLELKNGEKFSGVLSGETSESITLKDASGKEKSVSRSGIQRLEATSESSMPQGLEANISVEQMADLLAWLKQPGQALTKN